MVMEKMFFILPTIFLKAEALAGILETIFHGFETLVSNAKTIIVIVQIMVGALQTLFSEAELTFDALENSFSVAEKTVGGAPAVVFHQQPTIRSCEKMGAYATSACDAVLHMSLLVMDIPEDWLNLSQ